MTLIYHSPSLPSTAVTGNFLARSRLGRIHRAFVAADLHAGTKHLVEPTMLQSAYLARVNVTYAWWAHKRQSERTAIEAGLIPLAPALSVSKVNGNRSALVVSDTIDDAELMHIAQVVGADRMLAAAVAMEAAQ